MYSKFMIPVIVGLPAANIIDSMEISKLDYNRFHMECQVKKENFKNTMDFNYITTEDWINSYMKTYQDIMP